MYQEQDLVRIAKRENNNKRKYLVVNRLQGKHIPVKPHEALAMFQALADTLRDKYTDERLLLIGFAETATAIGAAVAVELGADYMQTTREPVSGVEYLYFSEEHSHATEQKLVKNDIDNVIEKTDRIIFIEDEVTTGKTILNIINILEKNYSNKIRFSVASLLNGMDESARNTYRDRGIELFWLVKTTHAAYTEIAEAYKGDGKYVVCTDGKSSGEAAAKAVESGSSVMDEAADVIRGRSSAKITHLQMKEGMDARRLVNAVRYAEFCEKLFQNLIQKVDLDNDDNILVLGTEEFMYPALFVADRLEAQGKNVRFHATTRSPIAVSTEENYPLHTRYELKSLYDSERTTYIYDLQKYDTVVIITDAQEEVTAGMVSLTNALMLSGNDKIIVVQCTKGNCMRSSYKKEDVTLLLKDITGLVTPQPTEERERLIQAGRHYSEMLPIEYVPTQKYMEVYKEALEKYSKPTALAIGRLCDKIIETRGEDVVLVSLARAGIPIGILVKHYIQLKYKVDIPHYSISIIKGRGIDDNAMKYLLERYAPQQLLFVDGWIGKGAILEELKKDLGAYEGVSSDIAVVADPANVTELCGTHEDILIPSSCLNCTVSGLVSRTFLRDDIIGPDDFHGAVFYGELADSDLSYEFIESIERCFQLDNTVMEEAVEGYGVDEVRALAKRFDVKDINLIKPGIGETTRVLLRRVPWKVLIDERYKENPELGHIIRLAEEKNVPIEFYPLRHYKCCGIIKKMAEA